MASMRKPFQGVGNIIRFNWHFYLSALVLVVILLLLKMMMGGLILLVVLAETLLVSYYIYDVSGLYNMSWAGQVIPRDGALIVNIHAGFDETSVLLQERFPASELRVFDFYDPARHTEISIKRARRAYPAYTGTRRIDTGTVPLRDDEADRIFVIFAAHEIRDPMEREAFFSELKRVLRDDGRIFVTEHLRDLPNFLAYNVGFFHFLSKRRWYIAFEKAGLAITGEVRVNPFIRTFILEKYGPSA
jgi:SAM-dependent methyltransferase